MERCTAGHTATKHQTKHFPRHLTPFRHKLGLPQGKQSSVSYCHRIAPLIGYREAALMRKLLRRLLWRNEATTSVEYAIMLALVLMVVLGAVVMLGVQTKTTWENSNSNLADYGFGSGSGS